VVRKLTQLGHEVCVAHAADPGQLKSLSEETGATSENLNEVAQGADIVFLCVPLVEVQNLPKDVFEKCSERCIFVDTCNYFPSRDGKIKELDEGMPESLWVSKQIGKPVIKALNSILAPVLENEGRPKNSQGRIAVPVSGDHLDSKRIIMSLIDDMGFDPFDAGNLALSWRQQPGSPAYCTNLDVREIENALKNADKEAMPQKRDEAYRKMTSSDKKMEWTELVKMMRETFFGGELKEKTSEGEGSSGVVQETQQASQPQA